MTLKVSVIIPIFNAEKYLSTCIESLLTQTIEELEFIFVNDGSSDLSREIVEHYKKTDPRIILINQHNQGVSIARNNGLKMATGEYIGFVDADDYIKEDMYEKLYSAALDGNYDIVMSNFQSQLEGRESITCYPFPVNKHLDKEYIKQKILPYFFEKDDLNTACSKVYRNQMLKEKEIKFPERVSLGEDGMFNLYAFSHSERTKYIDYTGYFYRETFGSATRNAAEKDYFNRALQVYKLAFPEEIMAQLNKEEIQKLKAIKFINNIMSYIHIYFHPNNNITLNKRYRYVKTMITDINIRNALQIYYKEKQSQLRRYEKVFVNLLKRKSIIGLYFLTAYSRFRNN